LGEKEDKFTRDMVDLVEQFANMLSTPKDILVKIIEQCVSEIDKANVELSLQIEANDHTKKFFLAKLMELELK